MDIKETIGKIVGILKEEERCDQEKREDGLDKILASLDDAERGMMDKNMENENRLISKFKTTQSDSQMTQKMFYTNIINLFEHLSERVYACEIAITMLAKSKNKNNDNTK